VGDGEFIKQAALVRAILTMVHVRDIFVIEPARRGASHGVEEGARSAHLHHHQQPASEAGQSACGLVE
jgi:hypothetical protein